MSDLDMEVYSEEHGLGRCVLWYEIDNSKVNLLKQINISWYLPVCVFRGFDCELQSSPNPASC
jgi:hypothetical protein